jgi:Lar family restriction alleviation protein
MKMLVGRTKKEVKSCPYCGGNYLIVDTEVMCNKKFGFVECLTEDCGAIMRGRTEAHAVKMWNRRPKD